MASREAYLTLSLPFTPTQHLVCKTVVGTGAHFITTLSILASLWLFLWVSFSSIDVVEGMTLWNLLLSVFSDSFSLTDLSVDSVVGLSVLYYVSLFVSSINSLLLIYLCISIGQTFKHRILASVLLYLGFSLGLAFLNSFFSLLESLILRTNYQDLTGLSTLDISYQFLTLTISILGSLLLSIVYFTLSRYFLTHKLNLE